MHYQHHTVWLKEIERAVEDYRQNTLKGFAEEIGLDAAMLESSPTQRLLSRVEEKIRDAKHHIHSCRSEQVWMPTLFQQTKEPEETLRFNPHSLGARHCYEKALQEYKRQLDRYERIKHLLQEKAHAEKEH